MQHRGPYTWGVDSGHPTLTDRYGRTHDYLRVSLTDRCNFRCLYCMPADGVEWKPRAEILTLEEIERLVRFFVGLGVRKVRLTGGEPTVRQGYLNLVERLAAIPDLQSLSLTTNGSRLAQDVSALKRSGLTSLNVSLDTLRSDRFETITRRPGLDAVLEGIDAALAAGLHPKLNVVPMPGINEDEILDFVDFARERNLCVRFIEFMPFLANGWRAERVIPSRELRDRITQVAVLEPIEGTESDVAKEFRIAGSEGRVGFVSSVTESFCSGCSRIRLTADGMLKSCLFLPPTVSLRDLIRAGADDEALRAAVQQCLDTKWQAHPSMTEWRQRDTLSMVQIGG